MSPAPPRRVVVVGAGVAGLNAAAALVSAGADLEVTVLERRPYVGGRAYSYPHPALQEVVDSQHVVVGCCTNLNDFCASAGLAGKLRWYDSQTFLQPGSLGPGQPATRSTIAPGGLPAPLQYAASFLRARMLTVADKLAVARALSTLLRGYDYPGADAESVAKWYSRTAQTPGAIRHFWEPVVLATLNDSAANCSMLYAGKVFHELFLKSSDGGRLGIPTVPLSDFYAAAAEHIVRQGGKLDLRAGVESFAQLPDASWSLRTGDGREFLADDVVLALPFEQTEKLLASGSLQTPAAHAVRDDLAATASHFVHSPFISILLWFDREITDLHHAWLLDTTIQWFFHKSKIRDYDPARGSYVELVIAGSRTELPFTRAEILEPALAELARFFPESRHARLIKSAILKEARATFSVVPGLDRFRPDQRPAIPGLFLAGDWTRTEWPSTMEGAARSGRLAAGALLGDPTRFLTPDLPPRGLMRLLPTP